MLPVLVAIGAGVASLLLAAFDPWWLPGACIGAGGSVTYVLCGGRSFREANRTCHVATGLLVMTGGTLAALGTGYSSQADLLIYLPVILMYLAGLALVWVIVPAAVASFVVVVSARLLDALLRRLPARVP